MYNSQKTTLVFAVKYSASESLLKIHVLSVSTAASMVAEHARSLAGQDLSEV